MATGQRTSRANHLSNGRGTEAPAPLTARDRAAAERAAQRLRSELRLLLSHLPEGQRQVSAMSRALGVERTTCQRIVSALQKQDGDLELLVALPGVQALRNLLGALRAKGVDEDDSAAAEAAIDEYHRVLRGCGRSKSEFVRRLGLTPVDAQEAMALGPMSQLSQEQAREMHFNASVEVTGRWSEVRTGLCLIRPCPDDATQTEMIQTMGFIGHQSFPEALPFMVWAGMEKGFDAPDKKLFSTLTAEPVSGHSPHVLLADYCSEPLPSVTVRRSADVVEYLVDLQQTSRGKPVDIVLGHQLAQRTKHPALRDPPIEEAWFLMPYPARWLVFDIYLHRDLARCCIASLSAHAWPMNMDTRLDRWSTQLPHSPRMQILGNGPHNAHCDVYPAQRDLAFALFREVNWPADEFVGHRCEMSYPIWRIGYRTLLDYTARSD